MIFDGRGYKLQKHCMPGMHFILMEDYMTEASLYHLAPHASIHHTAAPHPALKGGAGLLQPLGPCFTAGGWLNGDNDTAPLEEKKKPWEKKKEIGENQGQG